MKLRSGRSIMAVTCPDCGAHLEDTWTGEACGNCGFRYLVDTDTDADADSDTDADPDHAHGGEQNPIVAPGLIPYDHPFDAGPSTDSAVIAVALAFLGGGGIAESGVLSHSLAEVGLTGLPTLLLESNQALFSTGLVAAALIVIVGSALYRGPVAHHTHQQQQDGENA